MSPSTITRPTRASSACSSAVAALLLAGCAGYGPGDLRAGASETEVRARMGEPSDRVSLPNGATRIDYARGPYGKHTYRIEFDAAGRLLGAQQLLTEANFESLAPGAPVAEVRERLGRPSERRTGWRGVGEVWSYRYEALFCRWFQVWLVDDRVREAGYNTDPLCEEKRPFIGEKD